MYTVLMDELYEESASLWSHVGRHLCNETTTPKEKGCC